LSPPAPHPSPTRRSSDLKLFGSQGIATARKRRPKSVPIFCRCPQIPIPFFTRLLLRVHPFNLVQRAVQFFFEFQHSLFPLNFLRSEEHTSELQSRENLVC